MRSFYLILLCLVSLITSAQEISPRYELVKMNDNVNTRYNEVSPVISPDGKSLYFFVSNHPENNFGKDNSQDIWVSTLDSKGEWTKATHMGSPFNQNRFNQVFNFMPDEVRCLFEGVVPEIQPDFQSRANQEVLTNFLLLILTK